MKYNFKITKGIIAIALTLILFVGSYAPARPAHAQVVTDIVTELETALTYAETHLSSLYDAISSYAEDSIWIKDYVLDPLAWAMAKEMLQNITDSTVNWINSGFNGSPSFVQNPGQFFQNIGDNIAGNFIAGPGSPLSALCSPISLNVRLSLALDQSGVTQQSPYSCTLSSIINNVQGATINGFEAGDFSQGGWAAFASLAEPQNSFYGAYLQSSADLSVKINNKTILNQNLLNQGNGFLSYQKCTPNATSQGTANTAPNNYVDNSNSGSGSATTCVTTDPVTGECLDNSTSPSNDVVAQSTIPPAPPGANTGSDGGQTCQTVTPGSVISSSLNKALGSSQDSLVQASMIDEVIGALASQLLGKVLGNGGLSSVSQPSNGQPAYLTQIQGEVASSSAATAKSLSTTLSGNLSPYITNATDIQSYASSSLALAEGAEASFEKASAYCQTASDTPVVIEINTAIATTSSLVLQLSNEYTNNTNSLNNLTSMDNQAMTSTSVDTLNALTQQYNQMLNSQSLPSVTDVQNAKTENGNVQSQTVTLMQQAAQFQQQCQLYASSATTTVP